MTDIFDRASELEQKQRDIALMKHHANSALGNARDWRKLSAKWCCAVGCGERIPDERRKAIPGVQRCVDCAHDLEKQQGRKK